MWDDVIQEERSSVPVSAEELSALETRFNITLPAGHREFLTRFGEGVVFNNYRIFGPNMIADVADTFRERWQSYFHWTGPDSALTKAEIADCVIIGDSFNSDEFALSPAHPGMVFFLPQDTDTIIALGTSLEAAIRGLVDQLLVEIAKYPEDEREEWDLRPVFNVELF